MICILNIEHYKRDAIRIRYLTTIRNQLKVEYAYLSTRATWIWFKEREPNYNDCTLYSELFWDIAGNYLKHN